MPIVKTHEQFVEEVKFLTKGEYEVLDQYKNKEKKIRFKHLKCGGIFETSPSQFINNLKCKCCQEVINFNVIFDYIKNHKEYIREFNKKYKDEYELLEDFIDFKTKILVRHKCCKHERKVFPHKILNNLVCPMCQGGIPKEKLPIEQELYNKYNLEYVYLENIKKDKIQLLHTRCNFI
jgi:hypothetical protein